MLDDGAREWLREIEAMHTVVEAAEKALQDAKKRVNRCKTEKALTAAQQALVAAENEHKQRLGALTAETELFFTRIWGISKGSIAARTDSSGNVSVSLIVSTMSARLLKDDTAAFSVSGDSLTDSLSNRLPVNEYLLVREQRGESLVSQS